MNLYWSVSQPILVVALTYIGRSSDQYRFAHPLFERAVKKKTPLPIPQGGEDSGVLAFIRFTRQRRE